MGEPEEAGWGLIHPLTLARWFGRASPLLRPRSGEQREGGRAVGGLGRPDGWARGDAGAFSLFFLFYFSFKLFCFHFSFILFLFL